MSSTIEIYLLTCNVNGKKYVGVSKNGAVKRFKEHCKHTRKGSRTLLHKAMRKYGLDSFNVRIIKRVDTWQEAIVFEAAAIVLHGTFVPDGYNLTKGGEGTVGYQHSVEARSAMSTKHIGKILSTETRQRMSEASRGRPKPEGFGAKIALLNQNRVLSDETKQRQAARLLQVVRSPEFKVRITAANKARVLTPEQRQRLATINLGRKHRAPAIEKIIQANHRRVWTPEMRANMSAGLRKALARPEVKAKMAASNSRRVWTPEMRAKMSAALSGKPKSRKTSVVDTQT